MMNQTQKNEVPNLMPVIRDVYFDLSKVTEENVDSQSWRPQYLWPQYAGTEFYYFSRIYVCLIFTQHVTV
jgi:hypothetical protein